MEEQTSTSAVREPVPARRPTALKAFWRTIRKPLAKSRLFKHALARLLASTLRVVKLTNPLVAGSSDLEKGYSNLSPGIIALWHGQHFLTPTYYPRDRRLVAMVSKSADAELNAMVFEKLGFETVRGSGGRESDKHLDKGGARALIALKRALDSGSNVAMIADIAKGTPRQAGLGIVTLAKISGRPVIPVAVATSRRKVLAKSWDRTTVNLPFGRGAVVIGDPIMVSRGADGCELERKRRAVTDALNLATESAYRLVDGTQ
jgi:lysophospholipid acyltransferase (LPLAT)-like uncharacterized protein